MQRISASVAFLQAVDGVMYGDYQTGDWLKLAEDAGSTATKIDDIVRNWDSIWEDYEIVADSKPLTILYSHPSGLRFVHIVFHAISTDQEFTSAEWTPASMEYMGIKSYEREYSGTKKEKKVAFSIDLDEFTRSPNYRVLFGDHALEDLDLPKSIPLSFFVIEDAVFKTLGFNLTVDLRFLYCQNATSVSSFIAALPLPNSEMYYVSPGHQNRPGLAGDDDKTLRIRVVPSLNKFQNPRTDSKEFSRTWNRELSRDLRT